MFLLQKENGDCIFLYNGKCKIYPFRPIDCRLFPLDVELKDGRYVWIKYSLCEGSKQVMTKEKAFRRLLPFLRGQLNEYAKTKTQLCLNGQYEELGFIDDSA